MSEQALKNRISEAMKGAMRARDKIRLGTIRLMLAELKRTEVDERIELDDGRIIAILDKMIKQRRESIKHYQSGGRPELADAEQNEIDIIQEFLPPELSENEIGLIVSQAISDAGATSMKDMGAVMNLVKPQVTGRCDMSSVSMLVKQKLS